VGLFALFLPTASIVPALQAQQPNPEAALRAERSRLDQLRREREQLQRRMLELRGTVSTLEEEIANLDRQAETTSRLVRSLENQLQVISGEVASTTADLVRAEDELTMKRAVLHRRLVDIYKRGNLYEVEVILAAQSFGDLVSRYKYLYLLARRDRALVTRVEDLRNRIQRQRGNLVRLQQELEVNREDRATEAKRLRDLQAARARSLAQAQRGARDAAAGIERIARDEQRVSNVIASLEAARRRAEAASPAAPAGSSLSTSDLGRLDWPVEGTILYSFGRLVNPDHTTVRWNGIGIAAPEGSPVRSVASGRVVVAEAVGTYGLTIIIQHGGGDYSVYGSLSRLAVTKETIVSKGQVIGFVGSADPDLPSRLHFEIRPQGRAVDPLEWLRRTAAR
jgi:murein hydrolase activator